MMHTSMSEVERSSEIDKRIQNEHMRCGFRQKCIFYSLSLSLHV